MRFKVKSEVEKEEIMEEKINERKNEMRLKKKDFPPKISFNKFLY